MFTQFPKPGTAYPIGESQFDRIGGITLEEVFHLRSKCCVSRPESANGLLPREQRRLRLECVGIVQVVVGSVFSEWYNTPHCNSTIRHSTAPRVRPPLHLP